MKRPLGPFVLALLTLTAPAVAQSSLALKAGDVAIEAQADGFHLFVKASTGRASVLLTEAFETPDHKLATYALRAVGPNPVNDAEPRLLDGKFLALPHHSLLSSTVITHPRLGRVFQIVLPPNVEYGNASFPNSRYGAINVPQTLAADQPLWFSIRTFAKPYADYSGAYQDNAFELRAFLAQQAATSPDVYLPGLYEDFGRLGTPYQSTGIQDALDRVHQALKRPGDSLDMVLAIDTTKSMVANLEAVKRGLLGPIRAEAGRYKTFRIGLVFYRDYMEDYLAKAVAFTSDLDQVQRDLDQAAAAGGGDLPEAVSEALWTGLTSYSWTAQNRVLLLLGDAPQHPAPRGSVTEAAVRQRAAEEGVELQMIMLPQTRP